MSKGWISLHRKIREHWIWQEKPFDKRSAWIDLLMEVNHKDNKFLLGNELVEVPRGSTITSIRQLCDRWKWSNTKVTTFLKLLKEDGMIDFKSDKKKTVITIVNYESYQNTNDTETSQERHESDTETSQKHTNNNDNNENNDNNISSCEEDEGLKFPEGSIEYRLADYLRKYILKNNDKAKVPDDSDMDRWSQHIDYMIRLDNRSADDIKAVIEFSQTDDFWMTNVLSTSKLRKQFDQLYLKSQQKKQSFKQQNQSNKVKTKFHLAKSRGDKYTADELEQLVLNKQKNRRKNG